MTQFGEILVENFAYGVQDGTVPLYTDGVPTGEEVDVKDLVIDPFPGSPLGPKYRIRMRRGEMFDEFVSKMGLAKLTVVGDSGLALPDAMGERRFH